MTGYVFLCYALEGEDLGALRERLELITLGARDAGLRTYAHIRDEQHWRIGEVAIEQILKVAFERIAGADAVLLDLTTSAGSRRVGLNIEAGYAKALEKPILALWHESDRPTMTTALADHEVSYRCNDDLRPATRRLLSQVKAQSPTRI